MPVILALPTIGRCRQFTNSSYSGWRCDTGSYDRQTKVRLVAVDLDGTLLTSAGTPAIQGAAMLRQAARKGIHVVLATTRNPQSTGLLCQQLGLSDPMICTNGAQVWGSPEGPVWFEKSIPRAVGLEIARMADEHAWELSTTVGTITYWRRRPGQSIGLAGNRLVVETNVDSMVGNPVRILANQPEAIEGLAALCLERFQDTCRVEKFDHPDGSPHSLGIFAVGTGKGAALRLVLDRLSLTAENALAVGDHYNDLAMFEVAGMSAAMGNAPEAVRRCARAIVPTNDQEGVAWAIREIVFGQEPVTGEDADAA